MISKPVTVIYTVDEQTGIGVLDGKYVRFTEAPIEDGTVSEKIDAILAADAVNEYVAAQLRIPDEFVEIREAVQTKIGALQSVL